ncbi:MAG: PKD domain-containing protein [Acidobacteriota bacterium]
MRLVVFFVFVFSLITSDARAQRTASPVPLDGIRLRPEGLLQFDSMATFQSTLRALEEVTSRPEPPPERGGTDYGDPRDGREDEDDDSEPDEPLLDAFETALGFASFRQVLLKEEDALLEAGVDPENIKVDLHYVNDDILRTVLNADLEVMIGRSIFKFINRGLLVEITDGDFLTLEEVQLVQDCALVSLNAEIERILLIEETQPLAISGQLISEAVRTLRPSGTNLHFHLIHSDKTQNECDAAFTCQSLGDFNYSFTNLSDCAAPMEYLWDFDDGVTSAATSPNHVFPGPGTYDVKLTVHDANGEVGVVIKTIVIGECNADFHWNANGGTVSFNNDSTGGTTFEWDFGDATTGNVENPLHVYAASGSFEVCVTVTNASGCTDRHCELVTVEIDNCCRRQSRQKEKDHPYASGQRRLKTKIAQTNIGVLGIHKIKARTVNYKKKSNGNWKKEKADVISAALGGEVFTESAAGADCAVAQPLMGAEIRQDKKTAKHVNSHSATLWTRPGSAISAHAAIDGGSTYNATMSLHDRNCP